MHFSGGRDSRGGAFGGGMLKASGSIFILLATTLYGFRRAEGFREQYAQMEYLQQLFYRVQSEIRYARSPLGEICSQIGRNAKEPYRSWLLQMGKKMLEKDGVSLAALWEAGVRERLVGAGLGDTELQRLTELGGRLGLMDLDMQVKAIDLYLEQLSRSMEAARAQMGDRIRLSRCLGVMGGILLVILLL